MSTELPGLDLERLRRYVDQRRPGMLRGELTGRLIEGGRSNLTYVVSDGTGQWVVRRPPLGHVLATAHDMGREYRVMTALAGTAVPVPSTYLLCTDEEIIGAPFYLMQHVPGTVYRAPGSTARLLPEQRREVALRLVDVLADLHAIDPEAVGLGDFGRPDGYLERQLRRWNKQLAASRSRELDGIEDLSALLGERLPETRHSGIVHGDYRMDNAIVGDRLNITAVLDWEMATLGDPLTDLGLLHVYWEGLDGAEHNPITKGVGPAYGFPPTSELFERYARRSGTDLSQMDWYVAFGFFKCAVILEGIHYRYTHNQTVGVGFEHIGALVPALVSQGLETLREA